MSFADAIKSCLSQYATFAGRASRSEYWWFFLFYVLAYVAAFVVDTVLGTPLIITVLVILALFLPVLSAAVRRLHDTSRSGWWYLVGLIPLIGGIWLLVLLAQPGDGDENRYGRPSVAPAG